jgi:hypothetical protein
MKTRHRWKENIKMVLSYKGVDCGCWRLFNGGCCEHNNKPSGFIKGRELTDGLTDSHRLSL